MQESEGEKREAGGDEAAETKHRRGLAGASDPRSRSARKARAAAILEAASAAICMRLFQAVTACRAVRQGALDALLNYAEVRVSNPS